ncbi:sugar ABC transporter ATP-binding protein [Castellaniella caeni]|uniref:sugar ABC transporter ATP-binding protein n=1 Tax=Castellaniella caeni TaxID=266123 RepID=UPI00082B4A23|nr:sugar ABC transporter ATP-binding protein [Castellaniella caeni]
MSQLSRSPAAAAAPSQAPVVEARGLVKRFGAMTALNDVSLAVYAGESHALVGRNGAGKSTLVSMLTGLRAPDVGQVLFGGQAAPPVSDPLAWRKHVACVYQHSTIIRNLTVAENLFINRQPCRHGLIDWRRLNEAARALLDEWHIDVAEDALADSLGIESRQQVEIARALSYGAHFIILDEPTAQLDGEEIRRLFKRIRELQDRGVTFLFISHHLQEIYDICQTVTVLRDARHIVTGPVGEIDKTRLIEAMTGEAADRSSAPRASAALAADTPVLLSLEGVGGEHFKHVDLAIRQGEVLGLTGSTSSGRTELGEAVAGLKPYATGAIRVRGRTLPTGDIAAALALGVGCVPKERHHEGLVLGQSIARNATMPVMGRLGRAGFISLARERATALAAMRSLGVVAQGPEQAVSGLSGGNQQKVVMARALSTHPDVLVLIDPTAGVDVKSKQALLAVVDELKSQGKAVLLVSTELDDLRVCDRVVVMLHGEVHAEFPAGWEDGELIAAIEGVVLDEC